MKVKVLKVCQDKLTGEVYKKGQVIDIEEERFVNAPVGYLEVVEKKKNAHNS